MTGSAPMPVRVRLEGPPVLPTATSPKSSGSGDALRCGPAGAASGKFRSVVTLSVMVTGTDCGSNPNAEAATSYPPTGTVIE